MRDPEVASMTYQHILPPLWNTLYYEPKIYSELIFILALICNQQHKNKVALISLLDVINFNVA
jgi:hypothetical protein